MSDLDARLDLAKSLFGGMPSQSTNTVKGTVMSDSSSGSVSVKIGEVEYDDDGNIIVPESELIATIPIIGSATTGDEVTVIVEDGSPTAIAAPGWGDNIKADLQYMTFEPSGTYAGLHIHENATNYNLNGDLWLNSGAIELRDNGSMIAEFAGDSVQILGGRAVFGASTPHLLTIGADDADVSVGAYENGTMGGEIYLRQPIYNSNEKGSIILRNYQASGHDFDDSINAWLRVVLFKELCDNYGNPGTNGQVLTSQGSGQPPIWSTPSGGSLPFCHAVNTSATGSIGSTIKNVTLHSIDIQSADGSDYFEISGGGIKCKQAGKIEVNGSCYFGTATASWSRGVYLLKGSTEIGTNGYGSGFSTAVMACQAVTTVAAGDIIYLAARSSSSNTVAVNYATNLSIKYLEI